MRSEEIAIRAGNLREPVLSDVQRQARDYVVSNGIRTGHEYGAAIADGKIIERFTSSEPHRLRIPSFDGVTSASVEVHHNHPVGDSFSSIDLAVLLSRPKIGGIFVHGHAGFFAQAVRKTDSISENDARNITWSARSRANLLLANALENGIVSLIDARSGLWQVVSALLLESSGLLGYTANSDAVLSMARKVIVHGNQGFHNDLRRTIEPI